MFRGAEAILYLENWLGKIVLVKERVKKVYRVEEIDNYIRKYRTINEARLMIKARMLGVKTPIVYDVDIINYRIRMEYVEGKNLKLIADKEGTSEKVLNTFEIFGKYLGKLHKHGIIHGDPAITNVLVKEDKIYLIDFGLSEFLGSRVDKKNYRIIEKFAIDLNIVMRTIESVYSQYRDKLLNTFMKGYVEELGEEFSERILKRVEKIRKMGRYVMR